MDYFRDNAVLDYFSGGFDSPGEGLLLVHGSISRALAPSFLERMQKVAQDFAQQHQADQKLPENRPRGLHPAAGDAQLGVRGVCGVAAVSGHRVDNINFHSKQ